MQLRHSRRRRARTEMKEFLFVCRARVKTSFRLCSAKTSSPSRSATESRFADMGGRTILLVEGVDDENVLKHLCRNRGVLHLGEIKSHGGVDQLLASFPVRLKASED